MEARVEFDVFVSHNSTDTSVVEHIAQRLKDRSVRVWLDVWECPPGTPFLDVLERGLQSSSSVAIMLGPEEIRPWAATEVRASINRAVKGQVRIIPVLLPGHPAQERLPLFLDVYPYVDMRDGVTDQRLDNLVWGIFGRPPGRLAAEALPAALETSAALAVAGHSHAMVKDDRRLDALAIATVKRQLHISSEIIAQNAASSAAMAANAYPCDVLTMFVPLLVDLRWRRGYATALKRLLKPPEATKTIGDFPCSEADPPCPVDSGMLAARLDGPDRVIVCIQGRPACIISNLSEGEATAVRDSIDRYGRLGMASRGGLSAFERIKAIGVSMEHLEGADSVAEMLHRQRDVLIPLLARWSMPGGERLLAQEEDFPASTELAETGRGRKPGGTKATGGGPLRGARKRVPQPRLPAETQGAEEIPVRKAWQPASLPSGLSPEDLQRLLRELGEGRRR